MGGETKRCSINNKMDKVQAALDEYENSCCLPNNNPPGDANEINNYLNMPRNEIEELSTDEISAISIRLSQYAFYLSRSINREKSRLQWLTYEILAYSSTKIENYQYMKYEQKLHCLAGEDEYMKKLLSAQSYCQQRIDRLDGLVDGIRNTCRMLENFQRAKISKNYADKSGE